LIFLPLLTAIVCMLLPKGKEHWYRPLTLTTAFVQLGICLYLFFGYRNSAQGFQFIEKYDWIYLQLGSLGNLNIDYFLAVDGISIALLLMTSLVMLGAAFASTHIEHNLRGYFILFNILSMAVMGVFCALDFFLF